MIQDLIQLPLPTCTTPRNLLGVHHVTDFAKPGGYLASLYTHYKYKRYMSVHFSSALSNMNLCITNLQHTLMYSFVHLPALRVPRPQNRNSIAPPSILSRDRNSGQNIQVCNKFPETDE